MATDKSQNMDVYRQAGARLARPARAEARRDDRHRLARLEDQHAPDRLGAAERHAVHAQRGRREQRRGLRGEAARQADPRPGARSAERLAARTSGGRSPATTSAARRSRATTSTSTCRSSPTLPAGTPVTAHLQVLLGHRVGLRLRLRADDDATTAQYLHVAPVGERLLDAGGVQPERERLPDAVRQRPHRHERLVRDWHADGRPTAPAADAYPASGGFIERRVRPLASLARTRPPCCASRTPPTRASPGRAGSSTTSKVTGRRRRASTTSDFESGRTSPRSTTAAARATCRRRDRCTAGLAATSTPSTVSPSRPRVLPRDARPLGLRLRRPRPERPRRRSASSRACCSSTPNEADGLRQHGPGGTDSPNQTPLDSSPQAGQPDAEPERRGLHGGGRDERVLGRDHATSPGGWVDNYKDADDDGYGDGRPGTSTSAA